MGNLWLSLPIPFPSRPIPKDINCPIPYLNRGSPTRVAAPRYHPPRAIYARRDCSVITLQRISNLSTSATHLHTTQERYTPCSLRQRLRGVRECPGNLTFPRPRPPCIFFLRAILPLSVPRHSHLQLARAPNPVHPYDQSLVLLRDPTRRICLDAAPFLPRTQPCSAFGDNLPIVAAIGYRASIPQLSLDSAFGISTMVSWIARTSFYPLSRVLTRSNLESPLAGMGRRQGYTACHARHLPTGDCIIPEAPLKMTCCTFDLFLAGETCLSLRRPGGVPPSQGLHATGLMGKSV